MDKNIEREKIAKIIDADDFVEEAEKQGFEVHLESKEGEPVKKKANL